MIQLLVIAVLFGLIFWVARGFGRTSRSRDETEELVCDAFTGVYFPKKQAVSITKGGETLYFLNVENRDRFLTSNR